MKIKNWFYYNRNYLLPYTFLRPVFRQFQNGYNNIVGCEVGVESGINLKSLLYNLPISKMYAIDIDLNNCHLKDERIIYLEGDSLKLSDLVIDKLDFCYLDSNHSYEHVVKEIPLYLDKVKNSGILCGHDWNHQGVVKAVLEHFSIDDINILGTDWIYNKLGR